MVLHKLSQRKENWKHCRSLIARSPSGNFPQVASILSEVSLCSSPYSGHRMFVRVQRIDGVELGIWWDVSRRIGGNEGVLGLCVVGKENEGIEKLGDSYHLHLCLVISILNSSRQRNTTEATSHSSHWMTRFIRCWIWEDIDSSWFLAGETAKFVTDSESTAGIPTETDKGERPRRYRRHQQLFTISWKARPTTSD